MRLGVLAALLILLGIAAALGAQHSTRRYAGQQPALSDTLRGQAWSVMSTRAACTDVAHLAIRRATVVKLDFTQPIEVMDGTWTAQGTVHLKDAPDGLTQTTFRCQLSDTSDLFEVGGPSLTMGP